MKQIPFAKDYYLDEDGNIYQKVNKDETDNKKIR